MTNIQTYSTIKIVKGGKQSHPKKGVKKMKVLEKTKNHEIKQTTHIINNSKNIQVFSNMDVWDTYKNK